MVLVQSINSMSHQLLTAEELNLISIEEINAQLSWVHSQEPTDKIKAYARLCFDILGPKVFAMEKMDMSNKHVIIEHNKHFDYDHLAGNRYFLNEEQRQILIENTCEMCKNDGWSPEEIDEERKMLNSWNNKNLVEEVCGHAWLGFKGQTIEMV